MAANLPPRFIPPLYSNDGRPTPVAVPPPAGSQPAWATFTSPSHSHHGHSPFVPGATHFIPPPGTPRAGPPTSPDSDEDDLPNVTATWVGFDGVPIPMGSNAAPTAARRGSRPTSAGHQSHHNRTQSHPSTPAGMTTFATFAPPTPATPFHPPPATPFQNNQGTPYGGFATFGSGTPAVAPGMFPGQQQQPGFGMGTPYVPPQGMTPYGQPAQMPWGGGNMWQGQPSPFMQGYPMQQPMMGGMGMGMNGMPGGMGMPPMGMGHHGLGINMQGAPQGYFGMTPQVPQATFAPPPAQPDRAGGGGGGGDTMPIWEAGQNYGVPLSPSQIAVLNVKVQLNPLITTQDSPNPGDAPFLKWNMLFSSSQCQLSTDDDRLSWTNGRDAPATFPRVSALRLTFHPAHHLPWSFTITASDKRHAGVTCGELIDGISSFLQKPSDQGEYDVLSEAKKRGVSVAYRVHREKREGVPGGALGHGLRRLDFLCETNVFKGVVRPGEDAVVLPVTFWVVCSRNFGGMEGPVVLPDE